MPRISFKKIAIVLLVIVVLSRLDKVLAAISSAYAYVCESLEPLRRMSINQRYALLLLILVLFYVTAFRLWQMRK